MSDTLIERHWRAVTHNRDEVVKVRKAIEQVYAGLQHDIDQMAKLVTSTELTEAFMSNTADLAEDAGLGLDFRLGCLAALNEGARARELLGASAGALGRMQSEATRTMGVLSDAKEALERFAIAIHAAGE